MFLSESDTGYSECRLYLPVMCQTHKFETEPHPCGNAAGIHVVAPPPFILGIVGFYELVIKQCKEVRKPENASPGLVPEMRQTGYEIAAFKVLQYLA